LWNRFGDLTLVNARAGKVCDNQLAGDFPCGPRPKVQARGVSAARAKLEETKMKLISIAAIGVVTMFGAGMALAGEAATLTQKLAEASGDGSYRVAQSCPYTGTVPCPAGPYGPGGCYKPGYAECKGGLICTGGMKVCVPSNGGPAYCYAPRNGNCR
jgi:hypothetical protein